MLKMGQCSPTHPPGINHQLSHLDRDALSLGRQATITPGVEEGTDPRGDNLAPLQCGMDSDVEMGSLEATGKTGESPHLNVRHSEHELEDAVAAADASAV